MTDVENSGAARHTFGFLINEHFNRHKGGLDLHRCTGVESRRMTSGVLIDLFALADSRTGGVRTKDLKV